MLKYLKNFKLQINLSTKKWITLHQLSHQPESVKVNTIRNSYNEARRIASGPEEQEYSLRIVDNLYRKNGFPDPRRYDTAPRDTRQRSTVDQFTTLTLEFVSQKLCYKIKNKIKQLDLPIKVTFVSLNKLSGKHSSSRPLDKRVCTIRGCDVCPLIVTINKDCSVKNVVYRIDCIICLKFYVGETERTAHDRLGEHLRYAKYPNTPSNIKEALATHYRTEHKDLAPNLRFNILTVEPNAVRRKIFEAILICNLKPELNLKEELRTVQRFLTHRPRV